MRHVSISCHVGKRHCCLVPFLPSTANSVKSPIFDTYCEILLLTAFFFLFVIHRSAISQLPDLFVSAVINDEEEPGREENNEGTEADDLDVYRCPVFMNRVSFRFIPTSSSLLGSI